jgi:hypothetical protein
MTSRIWLALPMAAMTGLSATSAAATDLFDGA